MKPYSETVSAYGEIAADLNTPAGTAIATITAPPSGVYDITVYYQMHTGTNLSKTSNIELRIGGVSKERFMQHLVANNAAGFNTRPGVEVFHRVNGLQDISVNTVAVLGATETQSWLVSIIATKVTD